MLEKMEVARKELEQANIAAAQSNAGGNGSNGRAFAGVRTLDCSKKYVLVVEDNTMISMILEQTLQTMGYTAIVAENGRIAIEKFQSLL